MSQSTMTYLITGGSITVVIDGDSHILRNDHPKFKDIVTALKAGDVDEVKKLIDVRTAVTNFAQGAIKIEAGVVSYNGHRIENALTRRLLSFIENDLPWEPLAKFLDNLMQNPSKRAIDEFYKWVEHQDIPITEDGCWLGYKYLNTVDHAREYNGLDGRIPLADEPKDRPIYVDVHSGSIRQWLGKVVEVPRNTVDDNWGTACSDGLHVGSSRYQFSGNVRVNVKVNPRDVVTVPPSEVEKCRVSRYEIVKIFDRVYDSSEPLVGATGERYDPNARQSAVQSDAGSDYSSDSVDEDTDEEDDEDDDEDDEKVAVLTVKIDGSLSDRNRAILDGLEPNDVYEVTADDFEETSENDGNGNDYVHYRAYFDGVDALNKWMSTLQTFRFVKSVTIQHVTRL